MRWLTGNSRTKRRKFLAFSRRRKRWLFRYGRSTWSTCRRTSNHRYSKCATRGEAAHGKLLLRLTGPWRRDGHRRNLRILRRWRGQRSRCSWRHWRSKRWRRSNRNLHRHCRQGNMLSLRLLMLLLLLHLVLMLLCRQVCRRRSLLVRLLLMLGLWLQRQVQMWLNGPRRQWLR